MDLIRFNQPTANITPNDATNRFIRPHDKVHPVPAPSHAWLVQEDGLDRGYLISVMGEIVPDTHSAQSIFGVYATAGEGFRLRFGLAGGDQIVGVTEIAVAIPGWSPFIATWNGTNSRYEADQPGLWYWLGTRLGTVLNIQLNDL